MSLLDFLSHPLQITFDPSSSSSSSALLSPLFCTLRANWVKSAAKALTTRGTGSNYHNFGQRGERYALHAALAYVGAGGDFHSAVPARAAGEHAGVRWIGGGGSRTATLSSHNRPAARHGVRRGHGDGAARTAVARRVSAPPVLAWACMHMIQHACSRARSRMLYENTHTILAHQRVERG
jgi:hypothetical protein